MFIDHSSKESSLLLRKIGIGFLLFVHSDINESCFSFFGPLHILKRKLNHVFWIVFKLNSVFVLVEILCISKRVGNLVISLLLPTTRIAFNLRSVSYRFTNDLDPSIATFTKQTHFSFTLNLRTFFSGVTWLLALVRTIGTFFATSLSTAFLHQYFSRNNALSRRMTIFLTGVTAL